MIRDDLIVLAVDDDIINLKLLKSVLMKCGFVKEVVEAKNGSDAIGILKNRDDIDLILLDIIMPIMGGIEVLRVVRADDNLRQLPIIVLTTDETKKSEALEYGANAFLMKPIKKDDLMKKIATVIL
jgi:putative two-component system response regulator